MTTCDSSSDNAGSTSTSDVEEDIDHSTIDELSLGHVWERNDEEDRSLTESKRTSSSCGDGVTAIYADVGVSGQHVMETESGCNGIVVQADVETEVSSCLPEVTNGKLDPSVTVCPANGLVSEIAALSSTNCDTSSQVQFLLSANRTDESSVAADSVVSKPASDCVSSAAVSERIPSLTDSMPLLSIPQTDSSCADDNSFIILPSVSSVMAEDTAAKVMPPSVFSVPCSGTESDGFTDVNLDDDVEVPRSSNTLNVQPVLSAKSSRDSSPNRRQIATSSSSLQLDDAIVQSVLYDDDDSDISHTVGSSRHSTSVAFATDTDSAAFRTPSCAAASDVPLKDDGLHVVEPDSASFEEISLQSSITLESHNADTEQTVTSGSKRSTLANFFAR